LESASRIRLLKYTVAAAGFSISSRKAAVSTRATAVIPASAFFEFSGKKYPKAKHRFTLNGAPWLAIARIWRDGIGDAPPAFTMLTTSPGPDVEPYHLRQVVVLRPEDWGAWVYSTKPETELLRPLREGSLNVQTVREDSD
jgi:putative SOS response-associated peptidase YedK